MKIATVCLTHAPMNGGTKHQVYLAKELQKLGHEVHFFLKDSARPDWISTEGLHYHPLKEVKRHVGDVLVANWYEVADLLKKPWARRHWGRRVLILHDVPTANNKNNCLMGAHVLMGVSPTVLSIATGLHRVEDRVAPLYVHAAANPEIFQPRGRREPTDQLVVGVVGKSRERRMEFRGVDEALAILDGVQVRRADIVPYVFTGETERDMADHYRNCDVFMELPLLAGCPTCVIEAMACGTPVITTYHGTLHVVSHDVNGFILPKKNITYCVDTLAKHLTPEACQRWQSAIDPQELTWARLAEKFLNNLESEGAASC